MEKILHSNFVRSLPRCSWLRRRHMTNLLKRRLCSKPEGDTSQHIRRNALNIQMLSENLYEQIFKQRSSTLPPVPDKDLAKICKHLTRFDLWNKTATTVSDVHLELPDLEGDNIDEHFEQIAWKQAEPYAELADDLTNFDLPPAPRKWEFREGWTRYTTDGSVTQVAFPEDRALVFDVEILVDTKYFPTMATAASPDAWYSWCSPRLIRDLTYDDRVRLSDMIPLETRTCEPHRPRRGDWQPRLVIGHNVGFDRSFVKEQYDIKGTKLRFLDTMSMHIAVGGMTGDQRVLYIARTKGSLRKEVRELQERAAKLREEMVFKWTEESSMNNLNDVYQLHCKGKPLQKAKRDIFVQGTMLEVREKFQELMSYCAHDVMATHKVFQVLWPLFRERFPHSATLAGTLEMGTTYLPVNSNWFEYVNRANEVYNKLQSEVSETLMTIAEDAAKMVDNDSYKTDPWLWDVDWSRREIKRKKIPPKQLKEVLKLSDPIEREKQMDKLSLPKVLPHMPGKPRWFAELCPKPSELKKNPHFCLNRPCKLSTQRRLTHKLLRLTWEGFPLHYDPKYGWGYLVPGRPISATDLELMAQENDSELLPFRSVYDICQPVLKQLLTTAEVPEEQMRSILEQQVRSEDDELWQLWRSIPAKAKKKKKKLEKNKLEGPWYHRGDGPYDVETPGCYFFRLPRGDSDDRNVSNPLSKHFLSRVEDGTLSAHTGSDANRVLLINMNCSYWKMNMDRVGSQLVVSLSPDELPNTIKGNPNFSREMEVGAILPRLIVAGTVTRRAVESTWLTASNAYENRVGSELKSMIQCPPGYHFVGADVDSQELWIAALLGDAAFAKQHGCTALGWMTLQGNKTDGTDLHSKTANLIGISRDQAKVFNYGRIYGAGQRFAQKLLIDFNHRLTKDEASNKAKTLYLETKGRRYYEETFTHDEETEDQKHKISLWKGGSESHMFNALETIATSNKPSTPVLGCRISRVLEPHKVSSMFMTSRINWVVQSSAVDYLHLMLVSMRWLLDKFDIDGRFCISIHDEVRYLVNSEDRYRAALALQITNLLTRCMFAYKLGLHDLPQSVGFFSGVDIDKCLRKETHLDCKTPSNPAGLNVTYNIRPGETLDIYQILSRTKSSLRKDSDETLGTLDCDDLNEEDFVNMI